MSNTTAKNVPPTKAVASIDAGSIVKGAADKDADHASESRGSYRARAFAAYPPICTYCGFGIPEVLEVAHLDQNRLNNQIENLVILCANCHKMHDIGLIPKDVITTMRSLERKVNWKLRIKDAGEKAAITKLKKAKALKRREAYLKRKSAALSAAPENSD